VGCAPKIGHERRGLVEIEVDDSLEHLETSDGLRSERKGSTGFTIR
jgi:hypothetical protein